MILTEGSCINSKWHK